MAVPLCSVFAVCSESPFFYSGFCVLTSLKSFPVGLFLFVDEECTFSKASHNHVSLVAAWSKDGMVCATCHCFA